MNRSEIKARNEALPNLQPPTRGLGGFAYVFAKRKGWYRFDRGQWLRISDKGALKGFIDLLYQSDPSLGASSQDKIRMVDCLLWIEAYQFAQNFSELQTKGRFPE